MLPFVFEWHWDAGRLLFMGILYMILGIIGLGLNFVLLKTLYDLYFGGGHGHEAEGH